MSRKRLGPGLLIMLLGALTLAMPVLKLAAGPDGMHNAAHDHPLP